MYPELAAISTDPPRRVRAPLAVLVLVACCLLWGYSFPAMQDATTRLDQRLGAGLSGWFASRAMFNGVRFGLAGFLYFLLTATRQRRFTRAEVAGGMVVGAFFALGMFLQVLGLKWARPSVSGFLTSTAVIFAPLAQALILRRHVGGATWGAIGLAIAGTVFLSWPNPSASSSGNLTATPPFPGLGEILTVLAAMFFTGQIIAVDRFGPRADVVRLTLVMLMTTSVVSIVLGLSLSPDLLARMDRASLMADMKFWVILAVLVVLCSLVALHLMNRYQHYVSPATASVVYCTEPIFATSFSILFGTEKWSALTLCGGAVVIAAVLVVAWTERK